MNDILRLIVTNGHSIAKVLEIEQKIFTFYNLNKIRVQQKQYYLILTTDLN